MSRLLVLCPQADGRIETVLADVDERVGDERVFRSGPVVVLRLPADAPLVVRDVGHRPVPPPSWDALRDALRAGRRTDETATDGDRL